MTAIPDPDLPIDAPHPLSRARELLTPIDWLKLAVHWRELPKQPSARPRTVVLLPGLGAGPGTMGLIARALRRRGHRVEDWGLGRNLGRVRQYLPRIVERVEGLAGESAEPIVAVGWSLGGYLAREAARDRPRAVSKVITLGAPVVGGPCYTTAVQWYRLRGVDLEQIREAVAERYATPLEVPTVAVYSKRDGVVAWRACIDEWSPDVRHVEVSATHFSMGSSPAVLRLILDEVG